MGLLRRHAPRSGLPPCHLGVGEGSSTLDATSLCVGSPVRPTVARNPRGAPRLLRGPWALAAYATARCICGVAACGHRQRPRPSRGRDVAAPETHCPGRFRAALARAAPSARLPDRRRARWWRAWPGSSARASVLARRGVAAAARLPSSRKLRRARQQQTALPPWACVGFVDNGCCEEGAQGPKNGNARAESGSSICALWQLMLGLGPRASALQMEARAVVQAPTCVANMHSWRRTSATPRPRRGCMVADQWRGAAQRFSAPRPQRRATANLPMPAIQSCT